ncbi:hypothetical protein BC827DRAFT_213863 [Russula dissimulans]|nr:hypothetical protein BC827DRAFT_213863 [Russula dissimulans]
MVNVQNPVVEMSDARADFVFSNIAWEFVSYLDYEWSVIQGHRPYRWTIWIYTADRLATLMAVIIYLVTLTITTPINCKKKKHIVALAVAVWLTNAAFLIHGTTRITAEWVSQGLSCGSPNIQSNKLAITAMPVTDITLLLIMLIGLLRLRHGGGGRFDLGQLLWKQGVIYLFVATIAEITPAVFILLELNKPFDLTLASPPISEMGQIISRNA